MSVEEQVRVMESQLSLQDSLLAKMQYMAAVFDKDPTYSKEARDMVRANIAKELPRD